MSRRALLLLLFFVELGFGAVPLVERRDTDFTAYVRAADALARGVDPYLDQAHPYLYPPLLAVVLMPVRAVPLAVLAAAWMTVSAALLTLAAALLSRDAGDAGRRVILVAILFAPFAATQWNAQANALVLVALVLARKGLDDSMDLRGGLALGLAVALKPLALLAVLGLVLAGRVRAAVVAGVTFAASFVLVVPFLGGQGLVPAFRHQYDILFSSWPVPYEGNISLNGSLDRFFPAGATPTRHRIVAATILGLAALVVVFRARRKDVPGSFAVDAFLAATLLAAGSSWLHQSTVLFPIAAAASPGTAGLAVVLYAAGASWHLARDVAGDGAARIAALSGTTAIAVLLAAGLRRHGRDGR